MDPAAAAPVCRARRGLGAAPYRRRVRRPGARRRRGLRLLPRHVASPPRLRHGSRSCARAPPSLSPSPLLAPCSLLVA
eukprot:3021804-Pleurochrysis_carterae.AAC.1